MLISVGSEIRKSAKQFSPCSCRVFRMATVASNTAGLNSNVSVRRRSSVIAENADGGQAARPSLMKQVNLVMICVNQVPTE